MDEYIISWEIYLGAFHLPILGSDILIVESEDRAIDLWKQKNADAIAEIEFDSDWYWRIVDIKKV